MMETFRVEHGSDGWNRVTIGLRDLDVGWLPSLGLLKIAQEQTGKRWEWFGAFMDVGCLATKEEIDDEISLTIPRVSLKV